MISIDALYFLLLIELLFILACATVFIFLRGRKRATSQPIVIKDLADVPKEQERTQKPAAENTATVPQEVMGTGEAPAVKQEKSSPDYESCKIELTVLQEKLKEKTQLLNDLQTKFDELEKEYLILYRQQQTQQKLEGSGQP